MPSKLFQTPKSLYCLVSDALHTSPRPMVAPIDVSEKSDEDSTVLISVTEAYENQDTAGLLEPSKVTNIHTFYDSGDNDSEIR